MLALILALAAAAQTAQEEPPVLRVTVYGSDPCPRSTADQSVVCARRPESERHRIPPALRERPEDAEQSWAERAQSLETVGRTGTQSCSTVGPGGFTGCWDEMSARPAASASRRGSKANRANPRLRCHHRSPTLPSGTGRERA